MAARPKTRPIPAASSAPASPRGALGPQFPFWFAQLRIGVSLVTGSGWYALYTRRHVGHFEHQHGRENERAAYNQRCLERARETGRTVLGRHGGFCDLFVPVVRAGRVRESLVAGPFLLEPVTSEGILEGWHALTGAHGSLGDAEFAGYVSMWLGTRNLDALGHATFQRTVELLARVIAEEEDVSVLAAEFRTLTFALSELVNVDLMWTAVHEMVDQVTERHWASRFTNDQRLELHLRGVPELVAVALIAGRTDERDPVDEMVRRRRFQVACAIMARARGNLVSGPIGEHGVTFLATSAGSAARSRALLVDIGERAEQMAKRKFGLRLHLGLGPTDAATSLPLCNELALGAAERALAQGVRLLDAVGVQNLREHALRDARRQLAEQPRVTGKLAARFDRYAELVALRCGYRLELTAAHLEAGFERLAEPFLQRGALDAATFDDLCREIARVAKTASALNELFVVYRRVVADLENVLQKPGTAHQERSLHRGVTYVREHVTEPITLRQIARVAGFAPAYFSRLFRQRERVTFECYVMKLRLERAKQALTRTTLRTSRIAELSGFGSNQYFHRVFKREVGETPLAYRRRTTLRQGPGHARGRDEGPAAAQAAGAGDGPTNFSHEPIRWHHGRR